MITNISQFKEEYENFCKGDALGARIASQLDAYGGRHAFALFWEQRDDDGRLTSIISKFGSSVTILEKGADAEELEQFLRFIEFNTISAPYSFANKIYNECNIDIRTIMKYNSTNIDRAQHQVDDFCKDIDLKQIYDIILICHGNPKNMRNFEGWITDLSHRIRHGYSDAVALQVDGKIVSCAIALASTNTDVLIGGIATLDNYRNRGLAKKCIYELIRRNESKNIFLFCKNDKINFYTKLGFEKQGLIAEVTF